MAKRMMTGGCDPPPVNGPLPELVQRARDPGSVVAPLSELAGVGICEGGSAYLPLRAAVMRPHTSSSASGKRPMSRRSWLGLECPVMRAVITGSCVWL